VETRFNFYQDIFFTVMCRTGSADSSHLKLWYLNELKMYQIPQDQQALALPTRFPRLVHLNGWVRHSQNTRAQ
jgi:hypothetical protein